MDVVLKKIKCTITVQQLAGFIDESQVEIEHGGFVNHRAIKAVLEVDSKEFYIDATLMIDDDTLECAAYIYGDEIEMTDEHLDYVELILKKGIEWNS